MMQEEENGEATRESQTIGIVAELAKLLEQKVISPSQAAHVRSRRASVFAVPSLDEETEPLALVITCEAAGSRMDWTHVAMLLEPTDASNIDWVGPKFLDSRGRMVFAGLPRSEYRLYISSACGDGEIPEPVERPWSHEYRSKDSRVITTVATEKAGQWIVAAQTSDPRLANSRVRYNFCRAGSPEAYLQGEIALSPRPGRSDLWAGQQVHEEAPIVGMGEEERELTFCVVPPASPTK